MILKEFKRTIDFVEHVVAFIGDSSQKANKEHKEFHIVLCGGTTPIPVYEALKNLETNWQRWHFWLGDERMPSAETDLNRDLIEEVWLAHIPVNREQVHYIPVELGMEGAVAQYQNEVEKISYFDLCLLGIGEDGHTASLFPGNDIGISSNASNVIGIQNSPKAPRDRISLSANRLSLSKNILFIAKGKEKEAIIHQIQQGDYLPCNVVKGNAESLLYYCDC